MTPMDRRKNPYAPGAGLQPPELAGRNKLLEEAMIDMDRVLDARPTKGMMMLGLRGKGLPNGQRRGAGRRNASSTSGPRTPSGSLFP
jgi:hypothetical protein